MADKANVVQPVACDVVDHEGITVAERVAIAYADELLSQHFYSLCRKANFVYAAADYEQLQAKLEAAERDAARWRYVRNRHDDREDTLCVTIHDGAMVEDAYLLDVECVDLQAAIDAAMEVTNA